MKRERKLVIRQTVLGEEMYEYIVLKLDRASYTWSNMPLPTEAMIVDSMSDSKIRRREKHFLKSFFKSWRRPYYGQLPGWRDDSRVHLLWNGQLVGGLYVCSGNEFSTDDSWGQMHYAFLDAKFRRRGLLSCGLLSLMVHEAAQRAISWNLEGVYLCTDRYGLPEVFDSWGAKHWMRIPKSSDPRKPTAIRLVNSLAFRIRNSIFERDVKA